MPVARIVADSVRRLHRARPVDIVEVEESFGWFGELQSMLDMPVVVKLHGPAFLSLVEEELALPGSQAKIDAEGRAFHQARFVTSPSLDTLQRTRHRYDLPADWGRVIRNPIVMPDGVPLWSRTTADPDTLLFVGRFDKRKGGDIVIRAFGRLLAQRPGLKLVFVGPDPGITNDQGRRLHIGEFIRRELPEARRSQVRVTGRLDPGTITALRCESALTLVCSRWDNQPNTALEAMLQACPVVGVDAGGVGEIIDHGTTGRLARAGDIDDLCLQVLALLDDPHAAERLGRAARAQIGRAHGVGAIATETVAFFETVLGGRP